MQEIGIHWIDITIIIITLLLSLAVGLGFSKKQSNTDQYFSGGRNIPAWAIGFSIFATLISSVTFLAYPGEGFASNWVRLVQGLMVPIVVIALIGFLVPMYRRVIGLSAYEYFEKRFGYFARVYTALNESSLPVGSLSMTKYNNSYIYGKLKIYRYVQKKVKR